MPLAAPPTCSNFSMPAHSVFGYARQQYHLKPKGGLNERDGEMISNFRQMGWFMGLVGRLDEAVGNGASFTFILLPYSGF